MKKNSDEQSADGNRLRIDPQKLDIFLHIAGHDVKSLLTSTKAYLQLLERNIDKNNTVKMHEYVSRVDQQMNRLTSMVNNLVDVARMHMVSVNYNKEDIAFDILVKEAIETLQEQTDSHRIILKNNPDIIVSADAQRIKQVLTILLSNAVKHAPDGKKIVVSIARKDSSIICSVQDFGNGIESDTYAKLFDIFSQSQLSGGIKVNLFLAREIIQKHGGKLEIKSDPKKGSTFSFSLPITPI